MKLLTENSSLLIAAVLLLFLSGAGQGTPAATQIVKFGGALGNAYSPNSFTVIVGDTITWQGAFSPHPLSSTTIPATAAAWSATSGTTFSYIVKVPGDYRFQCDFHISSGMIGSFTASPPALNNYSSLQGREPVSTILLTVSGKPYIRCVVSTARQMTVRVMDFRGRAQGPVLLRMLTAGANMVPLDAQIRAFGSYIIDVRYATVENKKAFGFVQ